MPGLATLRSYKPRFLPHDLAAGVTLGAVLVPVGLAYGELAGLPLAGLYGSMLPLLAYALLGSSRQLVVGPDTAMAAIVAVAVVPLAVGDPVRLAMLCAALGVMVGVLCIAGRRAAAGLRRQLSLQAGDRGLHAWHRAGDRRAPSCPRCWASGPRARRTLEQFASIAHRLGDTNLIALAIGGGSFALHPALPSLRAARAGPGPGARGLAAGRGPVRPRQARRGRGRPHPDRPAGPVACRKLSLADFESLLPVALVAALLSFSDTMVTARAFAAAQPTSASTPTRSFWASAWPISSRA